MSDINLERKKIKSLNSLKDSSKEQNSHLPISKKIEINQNNSNYDFFFKYSQINNLIILEEKHLKLLQKEQIRKKRRLKEKQKDFENQLSIFRTQNERIEKLKVQHEKLKDKLLVLEVYNEEKKINFTDLKAKYKESENQTPLEQKSKIKTDPILSEKIPKNTLKNSKTIVSNPDLHIQPKYEFINFLNLYIMFSIIAIVFLIYFLYNAGIIQQKEYLPSNKTILKNKKKIEKKANTFLLDSVSKLIEKNVNEAIITKSVELDFTVDKNALTNNFDNSRLLKKVYKINRELEVGFYAVLGTFSNLKNAETFKSTQLLNKETVIIKGENFKVCKAISAGSDKDILIELKKYPNAWLLYNKGL